MSRACGTCGEEEKCTQTFGVETQGRPLGRHVCGWEDIIKMYLKEIEWHDVIGFIRLRIFTSDRLLPTW